MEDDGIPAGTRPGPLSFAALNSALITVLVLYWAAAVAFFPLVELYKSLPVSVTILVPGLAVLATFWGAKAADSYSRRYRDSEAIDSRRRLSRWLTAPLLIVASMPISELENLSNLRHPWSDVLQLAIVGMFVFAWWHLVAKATIGDYTFEKSSEA